jgi:hypothetical protein
VARRCRWYGPPVVSSNALVGPGPFRRRAGLWNFSGSAGECQGGMGRDACGSFGCTARFLGVLPRVGVQRIGFVRL